MASNQLCGVNVHGNGTYTAEGITKLSEALRGSAVTSLRCVTAHRVFAFVSTPIDTRTLTVPILSLACSIGDNDIGDNKGASALAAILKETQITTLG